MEPLTILLLAAAAKRANDKAAEQRQQKMADSLAEYNLVKSRESQAAIDTQLATQTPVKREQDMAQSVAARAASMGDTLKSVQVSDPSAVNAKPSSDYAGSQERAAATLADRNRRAIAALSVMKAPGDVAINTGITAGRTAGVVDASNRSIGNVSRAAYGDISRVRPNPWVDMAASAGMAYGSSGLLGGQPKTEPVDNGGYVANSGYPYSTPPKRSSWSSLWGY